jgi:predicted anti-sigma-YlaC factor YlaD
MRFVPGHSVLCERSREWISLRLDGELSELAEKMLESHLARCAGCRAFESDAAAITGLVRTAPLERPQEPIAVPRGRRLALVRPAGAVAATAAAVALGLAAFVNLPSSGTLAAIPTVRVTNADNSDLTLQRGIRAALLRYGALSELAPPGAQQM